jgi:alpha-D-ribose 1-methylphosphonate 5-triphosphate synthase subunit PhnG
MNALSLTPDYEAIRAPEIGLVQIQARMGGPASAFLPETPRSPARSFA